tara:strand:- start:2159 stop:2902 length:744 start_codon:yes stop_codon:yes gene_type:complete
MIIKPLVSSSAANSTLISTDNTNILIDCGTSAKQILALAERDVFDAIIITHEHTDHFKGAGPVARKTGTPVYMHEVSLRGKEHTLKKCDIHFIEIGKPFEVGDFELFTYSTRHDSKYSFGIKIKELSTDRILGYLTDTGSITKMMLKHLKACDALFLEANYDQQMITDFEEYDDYLKERIQSSTGHLCNDQTAKVIAELDQSSLQFLVFGHLSPRTNTPEKVLEMAKGVWPEYSCFHVAPDCGELEL